MNKYHLEEFYRYLKTNNERATKPRKTILQVLLAGPKEFKELYKECQYQGAENVMTFYNNIKFLMNHYAIREIVVDGENRYYEGILGSNTRFSKEVIYIYDEKNKEVTELINKEIIDKIKEDETIKNLDVENINIIIKTKA